VKGQQEHFNKDYGKQKISYILFCATQETKFKYPWQQF